MSLSNKCILEISELSSQAERLAQGSATDRARATVILQRITNLRTIGISSDEIRFKLAEALSDEVAPKKLDKIEHRARFDKYLAGRTTEKEYRDWMAGQETITWTTGVQGGYAVPQEYDDTLRQAMAQVDPVLDDKITSFTMTPGPWLNPGRIVGYDVSTITAQLVGEGVQQTAGSVPPVLGAQLRADRIYKITFGATQEAEQDIPDFGSKIVRAASIAWARRIGKSVIAGQGGTDIAGVVQALGTATVTNGTAGKVVNTDVTNAFFAVNRYYRNSPKCGWLMSDSAYKLVRNAVDNSGRPLLQFENAEEQLMGKPVYVTPSLANSTFSSIGVSFVLFGDLSSIVVRASRPSIQRVTEASIADITRGESAYVCRVRADAAYFDPSSGVTPPLVLAGWN